MGDLPRPQNAEQAYLYYILCELRRLRDILDRIDWALGEMEKRGRAPKGAARPPKPKTGQEGA